MYLTVIPSVIADDVDKWTAPSNPITVCVENDLTVDCAHSTQDMLTLTWWNSKKKGDRGGDTAI